MAARTTAHELDGIDTLLIDGNNLLHRVSGSADPTAQRTLIPKLRNAIPQEIGTVLMLDGHADSGTARSERIARGFEIRHSGSMTADDAIVRMIDHQPPGDRHRTTLVTDDITLSNRARHLGAMTKRLDWLAQLIELPPGKGAQIGAGRPRTPAPQPDAPPDADRPTWTPGRNATRKRGNPRRPPKTHRG